MDRFLHISFTFNEGLPKVQELEPMFNLLAPDWMRYAFNCWIVWTSRPASDFFYAIKPLIGASDSMLIVKLDMSDRNGWEPAWVWEWIDRKRQLGPPPPPVPPSPDLKSLIRGVANPLSPGFGGLAGLGGLLTPPDRE